MSYFNDPREMAIKPESGVTLEQDNRNEEMYHWGAMIVDLCDLPVEEYMKPMTVICLGSGGGDTPGTGTSLYTIKFVVDNETVYTQEVQSGEPIPFEVNAEKEGRNFKGWYYGNTLYSEGSVMPSRNLTLTAKYECEVSFVFVVEGEETIVSAYTIAYNSKPTSIPSTNKLGYTFSGWEPATGNVVTQHTTFVGTFEPIIYTVTWSGYTDGILTQEYKYGETIVEPIAPEKEGYTFTSWDKTIPEKVTSNLSFVAKFTINKYNINYFIEIDGEKGEPVSSFTQNYGTKIILKSVPSQKGYTFSEWSGYEQNMVVPAHDVDFVSVRTTNSYILSYYDNGSLIKEDEYLYGEIIIPYSYNKEGWTVSEWSNLPETMPYNNVSAYCTSTINVYQVVFVDQDNVEYVVSATFGTPIKDLIPEIEGKTFNVSDEILNSTVPSNNVVIEGEVTLNNYKVDIEGIEGIEIPEELPYGTNVEEYFTTNYPAEEGYYIVIESNHETVPADNSLVVKVTYKPNIWVLSYSTKGSNNDLNGQVNVEYKANVFNYLPETDQEGYNFNGWVNADNEVITEDTTMPNSDLNIYGEYEILKFVVNINDGDIIVLNKTCNYGTPINEVINDETVVEYISSIVGYNTKITLDGVEIDPNMVITSNLNLSIEKTEKEYVLTFLNESETILSEVVKFNSIITYPPMEDKVIDGVEYVFAWDDNSYDGALMPAYDLTIIGKYQEKSIGSIHFGSFKVSKSAYTPSDIAQYFNSEDIYNSDNVSNYIGEGLDIEIVVPIDEEMAAIYADSAVQGKKYQKLYYRPLTYTLPKEVDNNYLIELKDAIGNNISNTLVTDNIPFEYEGVEYIMHVYQTDVTTIDIKEQVYKQHFRLIKKHNVTIKDNDTIVLDKYYQDGTTLSSALNDKLVTDYLSVLSANGYTGIIQYNDNNVNPNMVISEDIVLTIKQVPNQYKLTFKNGEEIISQTTVVFNSIINYPPMDNYIENDVEYYFKWDDESYNGNTMPNKDLIITGKYVAKVEPSVYFGSFKVAKSAYTADNLTQYFSIDDIENSEIYTRASIANCENGLNIEIVVPIDEEMATIYADSAVQGKKYQKLYYRPLTYILPLNISNECTIELKDAIGNNISGTLVTDGNVISYNGIDYIMYTYQTDVTTIDIKAQVYKQYFKLIKK